VRGGGAVAARRCPARPGRPVNRCGLTAGVSKCLADLAMLPDQPAPPPGPAGMGGAAGPGLVPAGARRAVPRPAASLSPRPGPPPTRQLAAVTMPPRWRGSAASAAHNADQRT